MLKLHISTPNRPSTIPVRAVALATPETRPSRALAHPVFYDETQHRRLALEIASALLTIALMILITAFAISVSTAPRLPDNSLPKTAITRSVGNILVQTNLLPARRATAGHTTARAQSAPVVQPAGSALVTGYLTALP